MGEQQTPQTVEPVYKELAYEMADQLGMALLRLSHNRDWMGTLRNRETGESYTWEESFARSIEKLPGMSVDRRYLEAKLLPARHRQAEYRRLDLEKKNKHETTRMEGQ